MPRPRIGPSSATASRARVNVDGSIPNSSEAVARASSIEALISVAWLISPCTTPAVTATRAMSNTARTAPAATDGRIPRRTAASAAGFTTTATKAPSNTGIAISLIAARMASDKTSTEATPMMLHDASPIRTSQLACQRSFTDCPGLPMTVSPQFSSLSAIRSPFAHDAPTEVSDQR